MRIVKLIVQFFFEGHVFIALCALAQVQLSTQLLGHSYAHNPLPLLAFCATFLAYNAHKIITYFFKPALLEPAYLAFWRANWVPLSIGIGVSLWYAVDLATIIVQKNGTTALWWHLGILSAITLLTVTPLRNGRRLREVPFIKIFITALVWAYAVVGLPAVVGHAANWWFVGILMAEKTAFVFALCLCFDIRDAVWDAQHGVRTIPLSIGVVRTQFLAYALLILGILLDFCAFQQQKMDSFALFGLALTNLVTALLVFKSSKNGRSRGFFHTVDGLFMLQTLLVELLKNS